MITTHRHTQTIQHQFRAASAKLDNLLEDILLQFIVHFLRHFLPILPQLLVECHSAEELHLVGLGQIEKAPHEGPSCC